MAKVKVVQQSKTGLNTKVRVNGTTLTNNQAYKEAEKGNIPGYHGVEKASGVKFIRSNPNNIKKDNLG